MNYALSQFESEYLPRALFTALIIVVSVSSQYTVADDHQDFFEQRIRPLLIEKCIECHGATKQENGVRLDRRDDVLKGKAGDHMLINVDAVSESRLLKVLSYAEDDTLMPPSIRTAVAGLNWQTPSQTATTRSLVALL